MHTATHADSYTCTQPHMHTATRAQPHMHTTSQPLLRACATAPANGVQQERLVDVFSLHHLRREGHGAVAVGCLAPPCTLRTHKHKNRARTRTRTRTRTRIRTPPTPLPPPPHGTHTHTANTAKPCDTRYVRNLPHPTAAPTGGPKPPCQRVRGAWCTCAWCTVPCCHVCLCAVSVRRHPPTSRSSTSAT